MEESIYYRHHDYGDVPPTQEAFRSSHPVITWPTKTVRCYDVTTPPEFSNILGTLERLPFQPVEASRMDDGALLEGIKIRTRIPLNS